MSTVFDVPRVTSVVHRCPQAPGYDDGYHPAASCGQPLHGRWTGTTSIHRSARTMRRDGQPLWNAVDIDGTAREPLTCRDGGPSPIHTPHNHHPISISILSGESERHP